MSSPRCPQHPQSPLGPTLFSTQDYFWGVDGDFTYAACAQCNSWILSPRPAKEEMGRYYANYYPDAFLRRQRARCESKGLAQALGIDGARAKQSVSRLRRMGWRPGPEHRVLDIGCGLGGFLRGLKTWYELSVRGLDFDPRCGDFVGQVHDVEVDIGELADQGYPEAYFDLVTSWHCLEHTHAPTAELAEMARITKDDGWLVLEVPTHGLLGRLFRGRWAFLQAPTHFFLLRPSTLRAMVEAAGFRVRRLERPWLPAEWAASVLMALGFKGFAPRLIYGKWRRAPLWIALFLLLLPFDLVLTAALAIGGDSGVVRLYAQREVVS
jgi:SAM-dependent methyltransferase